MCQRRNHDDFKSENGSREKESTIFGDDFKSENGNREKESTISGDDFERISTSFGLE